MARCSNKSIAEILTPSISSPNDTAAKVHATQSSFTNGNVDDIILERKITLADNSVNEKSLQTILQERIKTVNPTTGQRLRYNDLLKARVDIDFVIRLERKNDSHTISNKIFDFSETTIRQLVYDGYEETKPQIKRILSYMSMPLNKLR